MKLGGKGGCKPGDVVRTVAGETLVVFSEVNGRVWCRHVEPEEPWREISEPLFFDPDTEVTRIKHGAERFPKFGGDEETDPLMRG